MTDYQLDSDEYIIHAANVATMLVPRESIVDDMTISTMLQLLADFFNHKEDDRVRAVSLLSILVAFYIRDGVVPQEPQDEVFADEMIAKASALVYLPGFEEWKEFSEAVRAVYNMTVGSIYGY